MTYIVIVSIEAELELLEIANYFNGRQPGLGESFMAEYFKTIDYLEKHPQARPFSKKKFREILINKFQVLMIYEIIEIQVRIRKIVHSARNVKRRYPR